jgi:RNA polymerase sigma factor (sigma-70 family)
MKLQTKSLAIAATTTPFFLSSLKSSQAFTINPINHHHQSQHQIRGVNVNINTSTGNGRGKPLHIASLPRTNTQTSTDNNSFQQVISPIDDELSAQNPDPKYYKPPSSAFPSSTSALPSASPEYSSSIISEIHSILDDGNGHINKELATSIWTWENEHLQPVDSNPFPFASKLNYSTRDGLRLIESIAKEMEAHIVDGNLNIEQEERFNDLVQEGVVSLMKCMVIWDADGNNDGHNDDFESFATKEISKSMTKFLKQTNDGVGVMKMNLDLLKKSVQDLEKENKRGRGKRTTTATTAMSESSIKKTTSTSTLDEIVKPLLNEAVLDENPTPDEIALSEMIRNDIGDFLERTLNMEELKVIRMKFGLEEVGISLEDIALDLGISMTDVQNIELEALSKLRTSFSNDYIGAYLDDDNTEEVSL